MIAAKNTNPPPHTALTQPDFSFNISNIPSLTSTSAITTPSLFSPSSIFSPNLFESPFAAGGLSPNCYFSLSGRDPADLLVDPVVSSSFSFSSSFLTFPSPPPLLLSPAVSTVSPPKSRQSSTNNERRSKTLRSNLITSELVPPSPSSSSSSLSLSLSLSSSFSPSSPAQSPSSSSVVPQQQQQQEEQHLQEHEPVPLSPGSALDSWATDFVDLNALPDLESLSSLSTRGYLLKVEEEQFEELEELEAFGTLKRERTEHEFDLESFRADLSHVSKVGI